MYSAIAKFPTAAPKPVTEILSASDLTVLRNNFSAQVMVAGGVAATTGPFPPAGNWAQSIVQLFLGNNALLPADRRELVILGVAVSQALPPLFQGIHVYWGLMVGLSANDIAATLLLSGEYSGIGNYNSSMDTMMTTVQTLKKAVTANTVTTAEVVNLLRDALTPITAADVKPGVIANPS